MLSKLNFFGPDPLSLNDIFNFTDLDKDATPKQALHYLVSKAMQLANTLCKNDYDQGVACLVALAALRDFLQAKNNPDFETLKNKATQVYDEQLNVLKQGGRIRQAIIEQVFNHPDFCDRKFISHPSALPFNLSLSEIAVREGDGCVYLVLDELSNSALKEEYNTDYLRKVFGCDDTIDSPQTSVIAKDFDGRYVIPCAEFSRTLTAEELNDVKKDILYEIETHFKLQKGSLTTAKPIQKQSGDAYHIVSLPEKNIREKKITCKWQINCIEHNGRLAASKHYILDAQLNNNAIPFISAIYSSTSNNIKTLIKSKSDKSFITIGEVLRAPLEIPSNSLTKLFDPIITSIQIACPKIPKKHFGGKIDQEEESKSVTLRT